MPKQGRRWKLWFIGRKFTIEKATASSMELDEGVEVMPTQEHVAALGGLARHFDNRSTYAQDLADEIGVGDEQQAELAEHDAFKAAAERVRNLIEQGATRVDDSGEGSTEAAKSRPGGGSE